MAVDPPRAAVLLPTRRQLIATVRQQRQELADLRRRLAEAERDYVTGLLVRSVWHRRVSLADLLAPGTVLITDINGFKAVNDRHGHAGGDEVLRRMADRLTAALPSTAILGRFGGDEFVAWIPDGEAWCRGRVWRAMSRPLDLNVTSTFRFSVSAAVGVAGPDPGSTLDDRISKADSAMYANKEAGRLTDSVFSCSTEGTPGV